MAFEKEVSHMHDVFEKLLKEAKLNAQRGARTHDPEIKSLVLYRLS